MVPNFDLMFMDMAITSTRGLNTYVVPLRLLFVFTNLNKKTCNFTFLGYMILEVSSLIITARSKTNFKSNFMLSREKSFKMRSKNREVD